MRLADLFPPMYKCPLCEGYWPVLETYEAHIRMVHPSVGQRIETLIEKLETREVS